VVTATIVKLCENRLEVALGSCRYIYQLAAPCRGARGEIWCV